MPMLTPQPADPLLAARDLLDALPCGVLLVDCDGAILHCNTRFARMAQREAAALVGQRIQSLYIAGNGLEEVEYFLREPAKVHEHDFYLPLPDGGRLPVIAAARRVEGGTPLCDHRVITVIDASATAAAREELAEQYHLVTQLSDTVLEQALELKRYSQSLEDRVRQRMRELHEANMEAIYMLAIAGEAKDQDTGAHVLRIRDYANALALETGAPPSEAERIGYSAILHDVGKMQVPDEILKKPGPLTPEERRVMEQHTVAGERILSDKPFFRIARQIARSHQENWDGSGYPDRLLGEAIPRPARIVRLVDVFDALLSRRPYKPPWPLEQTVAEVRAGAGRQFEPALVEALLRLIEAGRMPAK